MPGRLRTGSATTRRRFLTTLASASATTVAAPAFSLSPQRPTVTHGVQSGDVSVHIREWCGLAPDRPARMLIEAAHDRQLQGDLSRLFRGCIARNGFHRQGADRGPAARARHFLPAAVSGSLVGASCERADRRTFSYRVDRSTLDFFRLVRRHRGSGLGYRPFARWHAYISNDASQSPGLLCPLRRQHLRGLHDASSASTAERRAMAKYRH